jgi:hypothetical protein
MATATGKSLVIAWLIRNLMQQYPAHAGDGMYRHLLDVLRVLDHDMRIAGFTATPYRLDSGRLDEGDGKIFDDLVFSYDIGQGIKDGWLSPLSSKKTDTPPAAGRDQPAARGGHRCPSGCFAGTVSGMTESLKMNRLLSSVGWISRGVGMCRRLVFGAGWR